MIQGQFWSRLCLGQCQVQIYIMVDNWFQFVSCFFFLQGNCQYSKSVQRILFRYCCIYSETSKRENQSRSWVWIFFFLTVTTRETCCNKSHWKRKCPIMVYQQIEGYQESKSMKMPKKKNCWRAAVCFFFFFFSCLSNRHKSNLTF